VERVLADIDGRRLTTFDVAADGGHFRLNLIDAEGRPAAVTLPSECLNELLMTLPRIATQALKARYNDSSLRLVFPALEWQVEASGDRSVIVTIGTGGGFEASFVFTRDHLRMIADSVRDDATVENSVRRSLN
jgi:hypothetical protein